MQRSLSILELEPRLAPSGLTPAQEASAMAFGQQLLAQTQAMLAPAYLAISNVPYPEDIIVAGRILGNTWLTLAPSIETLIAMSDIGDPNFAANMATVISDMATIGTYAQQLASGT